MRTLLIIFTFFSYFFCSGQPGKIQGVIIDTTGLLKVNPVRISLMRDSIEIGECLTTGDGKFVFKILLQGIINLLLVESVAVQKKKKI